MSYVIGVDIGGTCTDCVVVDEKGTMTVAKTFSTPSDFSEGVMTAVRITAEERDIGLDVLLGATSLFLHCATVAENAVINRTLAKGGLIVTRGYEDTLFIARGAYSKWAGLTEKELKDPIYGRKPEPLIPRHMIRGIKERVDCIGQIIAKADKTEIRRTVQKLVEDGAETLGVCFLWSFVNPENENIAKDVIHELYPEMLCTVSHEVAPILGEYERTQTVALNIGLRPTVSRYLDRLKQKLEENGFSGTLLMMQAYGGLLGIKEASTQPVGMIEAGPVSGLMGSKSLGDMLDFNNIIAVDMGGTTFKAGVIRDGRIEYQQRPMVARYHYALPKMDIVSIGLAGGSVISLDTLTNTPKVGPESAGADPGPVCYNFGGEEPTITDVDLILGYLNEQFFLGGRAKLDRERALQAFKSRIADPLGMDVMEASVSVCKLTNSMIYDMLHKMSVERGIDPRLYVLVSYGGTSGMHLSVIAEELGVRKVIIPHSASVQGAFGVVSADITHEYQITHPLRVPAAIDTMNNIFTELKAKAVKELTSEGFKEEETLTHRAIDMRYRRQVHVITTPIETSDTLAESDLEKIVHRFEQLYADKYGKESRFREAGIEMTNFRLRGVGLLRKPELKGQKLVGPDPEAALIETRKVYFDKVRDTRDARCYDFEKLLPGNEIEGPSIIWTPITTIVVNPGQRAVCDQYKNIVIAY